MRRRQAGEKENKADCDGKEQDIERRESRMQEIESSSMLPFQRNLESKVRHTGSRKRKREGCMTARKKMLGFIGLLRSFQLYCSRLQIMIAPEIFVFPFSCFVLHSLPPRFHSFVCFLRFFFLSSSSSVIEDVVNSNRILYRPGDHPDHLVVIKYVPYVGDSKRALDEYTSRIFLGLAILLFLFAFFLLLLSSAFQFFWFFFFLLSSWLYS